MSTFFLKYSIFSYLLSKNKEKIVLLFFSLLFLPIFMANAQTVTLKNSINNKNSPLNNYKANSYNEALENNEDSDLKTIWQNYRKLTLNDNCLLCKKLNKQLKDNNNVNIEKFSILHKENPPINNNIENIAQIITYQTNQLNEFFKDKHTQGKITVAFTFLSLPEKIKNRLPSSLKSNVDCIKGQCALDYIEIINTDIDNKFIKEYNNFILTKNAPKYIFLENIQNPTYFKIIVCWNIDNK